MIKQINIQKIGKAVLLLALALVVMLTFSSCSLNFNADTIKSKLTKAGYTVEELEKVEFDSSTDTTSFEGVVKIFEVTKGTGEDAVAGILIIFDGDKNTKQMTTDYYSATADIVEDMCAPEKKSEVITGSINNVAFACYYEIRDNAGLNKNPLFSFFG